MCRPRIADPVEDDPFFYLFCKGLSRNAVAGMEGGIVTECTASPSDLPVAVGAGEAGIQNQFLEPLSVPAAIVADKGIVAFSVREFHGLVHLFCKTNQMSIFVQPKS